jgi:hypothetical protein
VSRGAYLLPTAEDLRPGDRIRVSGRTVATVETLDGVTAVTYRGGGGGVFRSEQRVGINRFDYGGPIMDRVARDVMDGIGWSAELGFEYLMMLARDHERRALRFSACSPRFDGWAHGHRTASLSSAHDFRRIARLLYPDRSPFETSRL